MTQPLPNTSTEPYEPDAAYRLDDTEQYESFDLEDRQALRRVPGLATELADVTEVE